MLLNMLQIQKRNNRLFWKMKSLRELSQGPLRFNDYIAIQPSKKNIMEIGLDPTRELILPSVGTPILATANGTVIKSRYSRGNGNYVTIKHNNIYTTQYLHMKKKSKNWTICQAGGYNRLGWYDGGILRVPMFVTGFGKMDGK